MVYTIWPGSQAEGQDLMRVIAANCDCKYRMGNRTFTCSAHEAFVSDERWLKGLLWMRHIRDRIIAEENREP